MTRSILALTIAFLTTLSAAPMAMAQAPSPGATPPAATPKEPATKPAANQPAANNPANATPTNTPEKPVANTEKLYYVKLATSMGDIVLELNNEKAPISVANFLSYTDKKTYDGTIFHRVINDFMIQGGGFNPDMSQRKTDAPIKNEWKNGLKNLRGTVAMARTQVIDSATTQFFINVKDNAFLDQARDGAAYAVFGKVIAGMDVVDKIKVTKTGVKNGMSDVPVEPVTIKTVTRMTAEEAMKAAKP